MQRSAQRKIIFHALLGILALFGLIALGGYFFRDELHSVGQGFVDRFGSEGMALGTFLAESIQFPIPVQFYLFATITSKLDPVPCLEAMMAGSIAGGYTAYLLAAWAARIRLVRSRLEKARSEIQSMVRRKGALGIFLITLTPIPFSTTCLACGLFRVPRRLFLLLLALRVPRILFFYWIIRAGWHATGG